MDPIAIVTTDGRILLDLLFSDPVQAFRLADQINLTINENTLVVGSKYDRSPLVQLKILAQSHINGVRLFLVEFRCFPIRHRRGDTASSCQFVNINDLLRSYHITKICAERCYTEDEITTIKEFIQSNKGATIQA